MILPAPHGRAPRSHHAREGERVVAPAALAPVLDFGRLRTATEKVLELQAELHTFLEALPDLVMWLDIDGTIVDYKPSSGPGLAISPEALGRPITKVVPGAAGLALQRGLGQTLKTNTLVQDLTEVWLGDWSTKHIIAHMVGWHHEMTPVLERLARGERPVAEGVSYEDVDAWNAKFAAAKRNASVAEVLLELDKTHEQFMHAAAAVPDSRFEPGKTAYRIVDLNSAHHYKEHGDQIRAWRTSRQL